MTLGIVPVSVRSLDASGIVCGDDSPGCSQHERGGLRLTVQIERELHIRSLDDAHGAFTLDRPGPARVGRRNHRGLEFRRWSAGE